MIYMSAQDFTGGVLSIGQLLLDAYLSNDWSGVSGVGPSRLLCCK